MAKDCLFDALNSRVTFLKDKGVINQKDCDTFHRLLKELLIFDYDDHQRYNTRLFSVVNTKIRIDEHDEHPVLKIRFCFHYFTVLLVLDSNSTHHQVYRMLGKNTKYFPYYERKYTTIELARMLASGV